MLLNALDNRMAHKKLYTSSLESLKTFKKFDVKFLHSVLLSRSCIFVIIDVMFRVDCQCDRTQNCLGDGLWARLCAVLTEVGRPFFIVGGTLPWAWTVDSETELSTSVYLCFLVRTQ